MNYKTLIGKPLSKTMEQKIKEDAGNMVRIIGPGMITTCDMVYGRINIMYDSNRVVIGVYEG